MEREKELSQLRAALDEAGNEVVANLRKYDEMYAQLDGLYGAEREQLTERLSKGHEYIEGLKAAADEKKAAVADMERRVAAIKDALAQLSATQQDSTYGPQSGAPAPYGGSSSHHQPPQQQQQSSSSGGSTRSGASAEAIQYALEEAEFVLREAKRRANDLEASFQDKERGLTQMRRDLADREQRKSLSSSSSYDYGGSGDRYGSGGGDIEEQRRAAAMAAVEASYAARAAEERANMLRGSLDDKSGELEWMRSEHAKVVKQIADLESAANAAADTQRKVDAKASAIVEESRRAEEARRAAAAARDPYPDRNVDAQREADLAEQLRVGSRRVRPMRVRRDGGEAGGGSRRRGQGQADRGGGVPRRGGAGAGTRAHRRGAGRAVQRGGHGDGFVPTETGPGPVLPDGGAGREQGARGVVHARGG